MDLNHHHCQDAIAFDEAVWVVSKEDLINSDRWDASQLDQISVHYNEQQDIKLTDEDLK